MMQLSYILVVQTLTILLFFRPVSPGKSCLSCLVKRNASNPHFAEVLKKFLASRNSTTPMLVERVTHVTTKFVRGFWYSMVFTSPENGANRTCTAVWTYLPWAKKYESGGVVKCAAGAGRGEKH